jgi:cytoskeletal protein CcmA (bactofilin family)
VRDTISVPLNDEDYKSIKSHKSFWGTYEKLHSKAKIKTTVLQKTALVGSKVDNIDKSALVLKDNNRPLVLVGNTQIKGKAFLPKRGVKSGNIAGTSYYGENYVYGNTALSKLFPKIDQEILSHVESLTNDVTFNNEKAEFLDLNTSKQHTNSFENSLQLLYSNSEIVLSNVSITGHIAIQSQTKIVVEASAKLTDVILVAPVIEIQERVKGTFQAFATESISVAKHVTLEYPSALVMQRNYVRDESSQTKMIYVADHSVIKGNVLVLGKTEATNYDAQAKIMPNAIIKGVIYCEQNLELRGTVYGTVYTDNFIIKEKGSIYQNHLFNAKISSSELELEFVSLPINHSKKGIAKWLY